MFLLIAVSYCITTIATIGSRIFSSSLCCHEFAMKLLRVSLREKCMYIVFSANQSGADIAGCFVYMFVCWFLFLVYDYFS